MSKKVIALRDKIQKEAVQSWVSYDGLSSIIATQGIGKSFIAYKAIYKALDLDWIKKQDTIYIFSFTEQQGLNLKKESIKFKEIYNLDPLDDFNIEFYCYQSIPKGTRVFDIYDELDSCLTPVYSKNITDSPAKYKLGLTGTESANDHVFREAVSDVFGNTLIPDFIVQSDEDIKAKKVTKFITKGQFLKIFLPVSFRYERDTAIKNKLIADMQTIIINHKLDTTNAILQYRKPKNKTEIVPKLDEKRWYERKDWTRSNVMIPNTVKASIGHQMSKFLVNLPSKRNATIKLLDKIEGQTIIFGERLALLSMITPYVITSKRSTSFTKGVIFYDAVKRTRKKEEVKVYIKKHLLRFETKEISKEEYLKHREQWLNIRYDTQTLIDMFNSGEINVIASVKAIGRGVTLNNVQNAIVVSYGKTNTSISQKVARIWRTDGKYNKIANLYIFITTNTLEEKWFKLMQIIKNDKKEVIGKLRLNIIKRIPSKMLNIQNFKI